MEGEEARKAGWQGDMGQKCTQTQAAKARQTDMVHRQGMAGLTGGEAWWESRPSRQARET